MGLVAAFMRALVSCLPSGNPARSRMQVTSARLLVPISLTLCLDIDCHIDYGAQLWWEERVARLLLRFSPSSGRNETHTQLRKLAATIAMWGMLFVASACISYRRLPNLPRWRGPAAPANNSRQTPSPSVRSGPLPKPDSSKLETPSNIV